MALKHLTSALGLLCLLSAPAAFAQDFVQSGTAEKLPQREGQALYMAICSGCHMDDGRGAVGAGAYPPLANSDFVGSPEGVAQWIIHGYRAMPPLGGLMDDEQIAALVNYLQTNLGNSYEGGFTAAQVSEMR